MDLNLFIDFINSSIHGMKTDLEMLYSKDYNNKRKILDHLKNEVIRLEYYTKYFSNSNQQVQPADNGTRNFTLSELAAYTGSGGNPAYVAVNGVVYDVTNSAAWAAATHFGLKAGNDLTSQFASCHAGANILNSLPKVGTLIL